MDKNYGYKHTKGFLLFIFIVIIMWVVSAYAQVPTSYTGTLVNETTNPTISTSTWQNAGLINQGLPCWTPADAQQGKYCGPNAYANQNTINFSYGLTDVYQKINVAKALPYNGAGLVTTGFKFEWESKNGNYWDDARLDVLSAYVKLYSTGDKKVIENFYWDLNYIHNWTTFSYDKNWANTKLGYRENEVGNVQFGFVGMDNNYFAGPYGPEVRNISFQLKYKPDPCKNNPLFSPECPNFTQELAKNNTNPIAVDNQKQPINELKYERETKDKPPIEEKFYDGSKEEGVYDESKLVDTLFKIFDNQFKQEEKSIEIAQDAVYKTEKISERVTKQAESIAKESQNKSIKDSLELNQETVQQQNATKKESQENVLNLFQGPNNSAGIVSTVNLPGPTVYSVQQPNRENANQQQNTVSVQNIRLPNQGISITFMNNNKIEQETNNSFLSNTSTNNQIPTTFAINNTVQNINQPIQQDTSIKNESSSNLQIFQNFVFLKKENESEVKQTIIQQINNQIITNSSNTESLTTSAVNTINDAKQNVVEIELPVLQSNFLTNKTDPINEIIENKPILAEQKNEEKKQTVKQNVQDNDVANTGVRMTQLAVAPIGYNQYTNFALQDAAFYAPKEIYRNQRNVDNTRLLRQLASDRVHQEMVDQQYRR